MMRAFLRDMFCDPNGRVSAKRFVAVSLIPALYVGFMSETVSDEKMYIIAGLISLLLVSSIVEKFNRNKFRK